VRKRKFCQIQQSKRFAMMMRYWVTSSVSVWGRDAMNVSSPMASNRRQFSCRDCDLGAVQWLLNLVSPTLKIQYLDINHVKISIN
jgi:hypothetical protein